MSVLFYINDIVIGLFIVYLVSFILLVSDPLNVNPC